MKSKEKVGLTLGLMLFVSLVYADVVMMMPAQKIQFSKIASLGNYKLHLQVHSSFRYNDYTDIIITKDTTCFVPERRGRGYKYPLSFFALSNQNSTDTVKILLYDTDIDFHFSGIKKNKLQFTKKTKNASLSTLGNLDNSDNEGNSFKLDKLLLGLSLSAIVGLLFLFIFYKKKNSLNLRSNPSA